ncbi:hypothetical protein [Azospirillum endophyticum]
MAAGTSLKGSGEHSGDGHAQYGDGGRDVSLRARWRRRGGGSLREPQALRGTRSEVVLRGNRRLFLYQESVGGDAQCRVMVESAPAPALIMAEAEFLLEFEVIAFDARPQLGGLHQGVEPGRLRQRRQPLLGRLLFVLGPFDQQPPLPAALRPLLVAVRGVNANGGKTGGKRRDRSFTPCHGAPRLRRQPFGQSLYRDRLMPRTVIQCHLPCQGEPYRLSEQSMNPLLATNRCPIADFMTQQN